MEKIESETRKSDPVVSFKAAVFNNAHNKVYLFIKGCCFYMIFKPLILSEGGSFVMAQGQKCCCSGEPVVDSKLEKVKETINNFRNIKGALIPVLHEVQDIYGYLPEEVLNVVSEELNIPMTEIFGVASFYHFFSLEPKGEHVIRICMGTACYIKGAQQLVDRFAQELKVEVGKTTADNKFTLEATRCLGACGLAPVLTIGEKVYGRLVPNDVPKILKEYR